MLEATPLLAERRGDCFYRIHRLTASAFSRQLSAMIGGRWTDPDACRYLLPFITSGLPPATLYYRVRPS